MPDTFLMMFHSAHNSSQSHRASSIRYTTSALLILVLVYTLLLPTSLPQRGQELAISGHLLFDYLVPCCHEQRDTSYQLRPSEEWAQETF